MQADLCRLRPMTIAPVQARRLKLQLIADPEAIREGLRQLMAASPMCHLSDDVRGSAEIVLAEVLNNIVEHAYAGHAGHIGLTLDYEHPHLSFEIEDCGCAMPLEKLPGCELAVVGADGNLPEGGFGWFLIRTLTRGLVYHRRSNRNTLAFWMDAG